MDLRNLIAAGVGLAAAFLLAETGLRIAGYDPFASILAAGDPERGAFLRPSEYPGIDYELVPGARGFMWGTHVEINAEGFRDREHSREKPPGVLRVLAIGDSITFGNELALEDTWPKQLEDRLRASGVRAEVLNLGVGGYDTFQEVSVLEHRGLVFQPDVVVVGYAANDLSNLSPNLAYILRLRRYGSPLYRLRLAQLFAVLRDRYLLARAMQSANRADRWLEANEGRIADLEGDEALEALIHHLERYFDEHPAAGRHPILGMYTQRPRVGKLRFAFEKLARLARENGFAVVVAVIPNLSSPEFEEGFRIAYRIVGHEAERVGFEVVQLWAPFRAEGFARVRLASKTTHPNPLGHRIIAAAVAKVLRAPRGGEAGGAGS